MDTQVQVSLAETVTMAEATTCIPEASSHSERLEFSLVRKQDFLSVCVIFSHVMYMEVEDFTLTL